VKTAGIKTRPVGMTPGDQPEPDHALAFEVKHSAWGFAEEQVVRLRKLIADKVLAPRVDVVTFPESAQSDRVPPSGPAQPEDGRLRLDVVALLASPLLVQRGSQPRLDALVVGRAPQALDAGDVTPARRRRPEAPARCFAHREPLREVDRLVVDRADLDDPRHGPVPRRRRVLAPEQLASAAEMG
jgi:hypothetical protein